MRILFLTYSYLPNVGGVERSVANLARQLRARGHDLTIVTHAASAIPFRSRRGDDGLRILWMHIPSQTVYPFGERVRRTLLNLVNLAVLTALCIVKRIDLVHCHHLNTDTLYGHRLQQILRRRYVLTLRGGETEEWVRTDRRQAFVDARLRDADFVTAVSESLRQQAIARVPEVETKSVVVRNPLTAATYGPRATEPRHPCVVFVGRLESMKNVECLIDAFHELLGADPTFEPRLSIVGDGSRRAALEDRARAGPARDRIDFVGPATHAEALDHIAGAILLALPSRCSEGCPNVVLEAWALGTCVVVSDLPSLTELVEDGVTGAVHGVDDSHELAARLGALARDGHARARLARAARERLATSHGWDEVLAQYEDVYRRLTGTVGHPAN